MSRNDVANYRAHLNSLHVINHFVNMCVGGVTWRTRCSTNDLTYLLMDAIRHVKVYQPTLAARINNKSPRKYLKKIVWMLFVELVSSLSHDDTHIKMMLAKGVSMEDTWLLFDELCGTTKIWSSVSMDVCSLYPVANLSETTLVTVYHCGMVNQSHQIWDLLINIRPSNLVRGQRNH